MGSAPGIEWVFFDVGNVLMDERPWLAAYRTMLFDAIQAIVPGLERGVFDGVVDEAWARPDVTLSRHIMASLLPDPALYDSVRSAVWPTAVTAYYELGVPLEGMAEVLADLAPDYRLGVIANQHIQVRGWMERHDLARWFEVTVYDCEVALQKPDPAIFRHALVLAGCEPQHAVMVGDRPDNDVGPAKAIGMRTIRLRAVGNYTMRHPAGPHEEADFTVTRPDQIPPAVRRLQTQAESVPWWGPRRRA